MNVHAEPKLTRDQLETLQHALGVDQYGRGQQWRNYFVGVTPECAALVGLGYMETRAGHPELAGGDPVFVVTRAGKTVMIEQSPSPPKLTRSQKRYLDFIRLDGSMKFGEYLKWLQHRAAAKRGGLLYE